MCAGWGIRCFIMIRMGWGEDMQIAQPVTTPSLLDLKDDCPFDHDLPEPPNVQNKLVGKGGQLATNMNNGSSTNLYGPFIPSKDAQVKWGKLPQKDVDHPFGKERADKGRCVTVTFDDGRSKVFPVSCSAHHLVPSQESLKDHDLLQYMCKRSTSGENNHKYASGKVWSDVGYDTNGSENGVYLPGSYAVGGGRGGLAVWYVQDDDDDDEHSEGYIDANKAPAADYAGFELKGKRGDINLANPCWQYVAQAIRKGPGQFHDRHVDYSEDIVQSALTNIWKSYRANDVLVLPESCPKCKKREEKIKEFGLPAPYSVVTRLQNLASKLRTYLTAGPGSWRSNVYTSEWCKQYMEAVIRGGSAKQAAEAFEPKST
jgi:hypothetical protein